MTLACIRFPNCAFRNVLSKLSLCFKKIVTTYLEKNSSTMASVTRGDSGVEGGRTVGVGGGGREDGTKSTVALYCPMCY